MAASEEGEPDSKAPERFQPPTTRRTQPKISRQSGSAKATDRRSSGEKTNAEGEPAQADPDTSPRYKSPGRRRKSAQVSFNEALKATARREDNGRMAARWSRSPRTIDERRRPGPSSARRLNPTVRQ